MQVSGTISTTYRIDTMPSRSLEGEERRPAEEGAEGSDAARKSGRDEERDPVTGESKDPARRAQERQVVAKLRARDTEVRAHEAAHLAAAGGIAAGGASFTYERGPDGKMYAVGGEVPISVQGGNTPEETIAKMRQVAAAALAPADPSPQDYAVASNARSEEMRALQELRKEQMEAQKSEAVRKYGGDDREEGPAPEEPTLDISA
jgi:hypothetical protein